MKDFKREYYKNLKKDFDEKIEKSAIFTYIRDEYEKDIDTREAGDDKRNYIKLRRLQLRYDRGEIDIPEFMEGYIRINLNMPKINMEKDKAGVVYGNRKTMARVKNRQLIRRGFDRLEDELAAGKRKTNDKFKALLKAAGEDKELFDRTVRECFRDDDVVPVSLDESDIDLPCEDCQSPGIVQMITYEMLYAIIMYDIAAKFYDMGFRQIRSGEDAGRMDNVSEVENLIPRKKDKSLDLVEHLFQTKRLNNPFLGSSVVEPQRDENRLEEESTKLLDILNAEQRTDICIPLKVDPATGCGVYILGRDYYTDRSLKVMENRAQYCRFGIIEMDPGLAPDTIFDIRTIDDTDPDEYQSVVDIWKTQVVSDAHEELRERNGVIPEGCSDYFAGWFSDDNDNWFDSRITGDERIACAEQLSKDKQRFMKRYN